MTKGESAGSIGHRKNTGKYEFLNCVVVHFKHIELSKELCRWNIRYITLLYANISACHRITFSLLLELIAQNQQSNKKTSCQLLQSYNIKVNLGGTPLLNTQRNPPRFYCHQCTVSIQLLYSICSHCLNKSITLALIEHSILQL